MKTIGSIEIVGRSGRLLSGKRSALNRMAIELSGKSHNGPVQILISSNKVECLGIDQFSGANTCFYVAGNRSNLTANVMIREKLDLYQAKAVVKALKSNGAERLSVVANRLGLIINDGPVPNMPVAWTDLRQALVPEVDLSGIKDWRTSSLYAGAGAMLGTVGEAGLPFLALSLAAGAVIGLGIYYGFNGLILASRSIKKGYYALKFNSDIDLLHKRAATKEGILDFTAKEDRRLLSIILRARRTDPALLNTIQKEWKLYPSSFGEG